MLTPRIRHKGRFLLLCTVAFAVGVIGTFLISSLRRMPSPQQKRAFDFSTYMNTDSSGPKVGERLDLQRFIGRNGEQIINVVNSDIFMLATIDPDCAAVRAARDEMSDVRTHIAPAKIPYILVSATTARPPDEFFKYADSLGLNAPTFLWTAKDVSPPAALFMMVIPSHILVRRDGTVLRVWPGTSQSQKVRFQMTRQIIADTIETATNQY